MGNRLRKALTLETKSAPVILLTPIFVFLLAITIFPLIYAIATSFQYFHLSDPLGRSFVGFKNYAYLLEDPRFWNSLKNTFQFITFSLLFEITLGFVLALLLNQKFRGAGMAKTMVLLPMITTPVVVALIWVMILDPQFGIFNYLMGQLGLKPQTWLSQENTALWVIIGVDVGEWTPFVALVLLSGLQSLPGWPF